jgi:hypothetical protein
MTTARVVRRGPRGCYTSVRLVLLESLGRLRQAWDRRLLGSFCQIRRVDDAQRRSMARLVEIEVSIDRRERQARCDVALARLQDRPVLLEQLERQDLAGKPARSFLWGLFVPRSEQFA